MAKLAAILTAPDGWDAPSSRAADRQAVAHYMAWSVSVAPDRMHDAEPILTDDGHVRLEWMSPQGRRRIAEIGAEYLYIAELAPTFEDSRAAELHEFNGTALTRFFEQGEIS